jgi:hypothetical protein
MPYLPSGRAVAISMRPLDELLQRAFDEKNPSLLFCMDETDDIMAFISVLEVEERFDVPPVELEPVGAPDRTMHCMTRDTGYTVFDIFRRRSDWPAADIAAFRRFMLTDRIRTWVVGLQVRLAGLRSMLTDYSMMYPGRR